MSEQKHKKTAASLIENIGVGHLSTRSVQMKGLCSLFYSAAGIVKRNLIFTVCVFSLFTVPDYTFAGILGTIHA
jgi:hypothetical protein